MQRSLLQGVPSRPVLLVQILAHAWGPEERSTDPGAPASCLEVVGEVLSGAPWSAGATENMTECSGSAGWLACWAGLLSQTFSTNAMRVA